MDSATKTTSIAEFSLEAMTKAELFLIKYRNNSITHRTSLGKSALKNKIAFLFFEAKYALFSLL